MRSGRQRRPKLFFHGDWRASVDDAELRAAAATSATVAGQPTAGVVGAAAAVSDAHAVATVAIMKRHQGRQRRSKLFFHGDWRASANDADLRAAAATSATAAGQPTAGVGAAAAVSDARAVATVAILRLHQGAIEVAMSTANHPPDTLAGARALVAELSRARRRSQASQRPSAPAPRSPFQQDKTTAAVGAVAHNMRRRARARAHTGPMTDTRTEPRPTRSRFGVTCWRLSTRG